MSSRDARSRLLTVLGDVVLPAGGGAPATALVRATGMLGVAEDEVRRALDLLAADDLVRSEGDAVTLTTAGRKRLEEAADRIYLRRPLRWDGRWRLLDITFADAETDAREALERELGWLGYGRLESGLRVCPWELGARLDAVLAKHEVTGSVEAFTSEHDGDDRALAAEAYDLDALRDAHGEFISRFSAALDQPTKDDDEALSRRLELVHEWRKFLFGDPGLPPELLPDDWLGSRAAALFADLYRSWEEPGWRAWEALVAEAAPGSAPAQRVRTNLQVPLRGNGAVSDERRTEEFRERLAAGHKVEVGDWMPAEYRKIALKFIEMHANSELMGALPEREWLSKAPDLRRKRSLAAKVQDEVGHAHLIYRIAEDLGKSRKDMFDDLIAGRTKFHNVFHYPAETWGDVAVIGFLVDGAAIVTQRALLDTSYAPYLRVMRRVVAEESLHYRHGEDITLALASGTQAQFELLQDAVTRWWEPIMHFFGHDTPAESDVPLQWGIKTRTNEESRQEFFRQYVPKMWDMGIEIPDPGLRYDPDEGRWHYTEPDWEKMNAIIRGEGPMTKERLEWRRTWRDAHTWMHEIITGERTAA